MTTKKSAFVFGLLPHILAKRLLRWRELRLAGSPRAFGIAWKSSAYAAYKSACLDLLPQKSLRDLKTVVDVGANIGDWSTALLCSARVTHLLALEPNPQVFASLKSRLVQFPQARCLNVGVGSSKARLLLNATVGSQCSSLLTPSSEMNSLYGESMTITNRVPIEVETLDDLVKEFAEISLLKIDVQGYEKQVLRGATITLRKTRWLLIEANFVHHYQEDILFTDLNSQLTALGFALAGFSPPFCKAGRALWADALYCRPN